MSNYNYVSLMGNISRDPEISYTPSQTTIAKFGIAINRKWKDQAGEMKEEVSFVNCTAFGKTAEVIGMYVKKGNLLFIAGRLKQNTWQAQDGTNKSKLEVIVETVQLMPNTQKQEAQAEPTQDMGPDYNQSEPAPI